MSATLLDNKSEYQTNSTSVHNDAGEKLQSQPDLLSNDGISRDKSVCLPEFYQAHAT
jgi:hypothetical protein